MELFSQKRGSESEKRALIWGGLLLRSKINVCAKPGASNPAFHILERGSEYNSILTAVFKDLHFAQSKVLLFRAVVPNVNELAGEPQAVVTEKDGFFGLKGPFEFGAGLVHGLVALQEFDDEDGELLEGAGGDGDGH